MPARDRLSALDTSFRHPEIEGAHMLAASELLFSGPHPHTRSLRQPVTTPGEAHG